MENNSMTEAQMARVDEILEGYNEQNPDAEPVTFANLLILNNPQLVGRIMAEIGVSEKDLQNYVDCRYVEIEDHQMAREHDLTEEQLRDGNSSLKEEWLKSQQE